MDVQPLISIVVPVYNVKQFLTKCLNSIIGQTYSNLEIIVVDDGSTDGSATICDDYAKKDNRISVLIVTTISSHICMRSFFKRS